MRTFIVTAFLAFAALAAPHLTPTTPGDVADIEATHTLTAAVPTPVHHHTAKLACWDEPKHNLPTEHLCGRRSTAPANAIHFTAYPTR